MISNKEFYKKAYVKKIGYKTVKFLFIYSKFPII